MSMLTIAMIRENPWNVITHRFPPHPSAVLVELAELAAAYCRDSEHVLIKAAQDGSYGRDGWGLKDNHPDSHEESEARSDEVDQRLSEFCNQLELEF